MKKTITFIHPAEVRWDQNYGAFFPPIWAYTLAAHVPCDWNVSIVDCTFENIDEVGPSTVFAFSGISQDIDSVLGAHATLKSKFPSSTFIVGGPMTWSFEQEGKLEILDDFDSIFILDGEQSLPAFLNNFNNRKSISDGKIIRSDQFPFKQSRSIRFDLYKAKSSYYYGTVIEVSRGCPFLCEFCDIRILPGGNQSHNKPVELIVEELNEYWKLGVNQFQFACGNFIGDLNWARQCVDAILEWKLKVNASISIFTWLTLNLYKAPDLMEKMRRAGFSILMIGVESVNQNSLLETAKVQNRNRLTEAVKTIQSYGFVIAPGMIFGFDSDNKDMYKDTLRFLHKTGLIAGAPSFLMALPGTPLYKRMADNNRLVHSTEKGTPREKITTNIRYLQGADFLVSGYIEYIKAYTKPNYQLNLFRHHLESTLQSRNYVPSDYAGYGSPAQYIKLQFTDSVNRKFLLDRLLIFIRNPINLIALLRGWLLTKKYSREISGISIHFNYWVYVWTNIILKHKNVKSTDFLLHSVDSSFDYSTLVQGIETYQNKKEGSVEVDNRKASHQARYTQQALSKLAKSD